MARKTMRLTAIRRQKLSSALDILAAHAETAASVWSEASDEQRETILAHSPLLARLIAMTAPFQERGR